MHRLKETEALLLVEGLFVCDKLLGTDGACSDAVEGQIGVIRAILCDLRGDALDVSRLVRFECDEQILLAVFGLRLDVSFLDGLLLFSSFYKS